MTLAARRFPDTIIRRRTAPTTFNMYDEPTPGTVEEVELRASVQPLSTEDLDAVEGARLVERLKVYVPLPGALVAAFEDSTADEVVYDGKMYTVEESRSWPGSHTRATILRAT